VLFPIVDDFRISDSCKNFSAIRRSIKKTARKSASVPPSVAPEMQRIAFPSTDVIWSPQLVESLWTHGDQESDASTVFSISDRAERDIETNSVFFIGWINENHVVRAAIRHAGQNLFDKVAVGIEDLDSFAPAPCH